MSRAPLILCDGPDCTAAEKPGERSVVLPDGWFKVETTWYESYDFCSWDCVTRHGAPVAPELYSDDDDP